MRPSGIRQYLKDDVRPPTYLGEMLKLSAHHLLAADPVRQHRLIQHHGQVYRLGPGQDPLPRLGRPL
jgi:hypothetical protein